MKVRKAFNKATVACALLAMSVTANADHSWADYHWARTTSSFDLTIINSTTSDWDQYVSQAVGDWSDSSKLNMIEDANGSTSKKHGDGAKATQVPFAFVILPTGLTAGLELRESRLIQMDTSPPATPR